MKQNSNPTNNHDNNTTNLSNKQMRKRPNGSSGDMYGNMESGRGGRGGGMSSHDANANIMEQQNNDRISELSDQVARLKGLTIMRYRNRIHY